MNKAAISLLSMIVIAVCISPVTAASPKTCPANGKLKILILSGQSNMVGFGQLTGSPGTMESCLKSNPEDYHWYRNWETFYLIGTGMGDRMVGLLAGVPLPR